MFFRYSEPCPRLFFVIQTGPPGRFIDRPSLLHRPSSGIRHQWDGKNQRQNRLAASVIHLARAHFPICPRGRKGQIRRFLQVRYLVNFPRLSFSKDYKNYIVHSTEGTEFVTHLIFRRTG
jgi:hypothetical protein